MLEHDAPVSRHVAIKTASLEVEGSLGLVCAAVWRMWGSRTSACPGGLCRPRPSNEARAVGNISRILVERSIHEGGLLGDAPMLKKPIARPALCARWAWLSALGPTRESATPVDLSLPARDKSRGWMDSEEARGRVERP